MNKPNITPYQDSKSGKRKQVEEMFDNISTDYDFMNRLITFGMDVKWRNNVLKLLNEKDPENILDIATGTGDMAILFAKTNAQKIIGVDISKGMLKVAHEKIERLNLTDRISTSVQDSEDLKFADNTFDAVSVTYGIRNFEHLSKGLSEIHRVLNPGGAFIILETSQPDNRFIKPFYLLYTRHILPFIARLFVKDKNAYQYLSNSAVNFPYGKALQQILQETGFRHVKLYPQFFGASTIYYAEK